MTSRPILPSYLYKKRLLCLTPPSSLPLSSTLEQQHSHQIQIEINEVTRFVSDVGTKISTNNTMPSGAKFLIRLLFDESSNISFCFVLIESFVGEVFDLLDQFFVHVSIFDVERSFFASHFLCCYFLRLIPASSFSVYEL
eukprot:TRINITY_DN6657_c0_g1_i1.p1 TRINITY_DN6657_c0_g1~~TRINITY_DN6657_c0_g1_i1.p1  ORF type:complete len:140 (+),score=27.29 TRINITY_DN6657_c0_g1_i1:78-497(+)